MSNDLISRSALIAEYCDGCDYPAKGLCDNDVCGFAILIKEAPAVDAVEVVRCKECLHRSQHECPMYHEEDIEWDDDGYIESEVIEHDYTKDNGFCDRGERRTDHDA